MSNIDTIRTMDAQVVELKQETQRCREKALRNLDKLHKLLLNGAGEPNSEEEAAAAETVALV